MFTDVEIKLKWNTTRITAAVPITSTLKASSAVWREDTRKPARTE